jgi:flagellar basal-body rod protein FlgC
MDYFTAFAISASGMRAEKLRTDVVALNLANLNSSAGPDGKLFQPLAVRTAPAAFPAALVRLAGGSGVQVLGVEETQAEARIAYEPGNPGADANGMVRLPGVNRVTEMANLAAAMRAYQANVTAFNASKTMALKALELGGQP